MARVHKVLWNGRNENDWTASANTELANKETWKWLKMYVENFMNEYIEQNIDDAHVRQILFSICGSKFVRQYYKDFEAHQPQLLCEPYMSPHVRESLSEEYQEKLDEFVHERIVESGLYDSEQFDQFRLDLNKKYHMYCKAAQNPILGSNKSFSDSISETIVKFILGKSFSDPKLVANTVLTINTDQDKVPSQRTFDIVSTKLCAQHDTNLTLQMQENAKLLLETMRGRSLPQALRQFVWLSNLLDEALVANYYAILKANSMTMMIRDPNKSAISKLIDRTVEETFSNAALQAEKSPIMLERVANVLNQLYVYSGTQSSRSAYYLLPMVQLFPNFTTQEPQLVLIMHNFMKRFMHTGNAYRGQVLDGAKRIEAILQQRDPDYMQFILLVLKQGQIKQTRAASASIESNELVVQHIYDLFIRWLEVCLVGFLKPHALAFVWDQCFLSPYGWKAEFECICVDIVLALKSRVMRDTNMLRITHLFESGTRQLTTKDIRHRFRRRMMNHDSK